MSDTESAVKTAKVRISPIWIVPIAAVILGLWLAINEYLSQGPTVEITFASGDGIEEGKTLIKVLSVNIGIVTDMRLSDDMEGVTATADLDPEARKLLRRDTQFWVVRPTVSGVNVSGLGTLLSGAYITLSPGVEAVTSRRLFAGLDRIPATPAGTPGIRLRLTSETSASVRTGSPILYRGYEVGVVEGIELDVDTQHVSYSIFIDVPYDRLVSSNTRFWDASGISAELSDEGIKLDMNSIQSMLAGGIAFGLPRSVPPGTPVEASMTYRLYPNESSIHENPHRHYVEYVVEFRQSLRGLHPDAAVTYKGIRVGSVEQIMIDELDNQADPAAKGQSIPVLIKIEPGRLDLGDTPAAAERLRQSVDIAVSNGLRATLKSGSIITGALYVELEFFDDVESVETGLFKEFPTIPTISGGFDHIQVQVTRLLDKLNDLPIDETLTSADAAISELALTLSTVRTILDEESTQDITGKLEQALVAMNRLMQGYSSESDFYTELNRTLVEIRNTLGSVQGVADRLADNPNTIVFPGRPIEDPEPKAPR